MTILESAGFTSTNHIQKLTPNHYEPSETQHTISKDTTNHGTQRTTLTTLHSPDITRHLCFLKKRHLKGHPSPVTDRPSGTSLSWPWNPRGVTTSVLAQGPLLAEEERRGSQVEGVFMFALSPNSFTLCFQSASCFHDAFISVFNCVFWHSILLYRLWFVGALSRCFALFTLCIHPEVD